MTSTTSSDKKLKQGKAFFLWGLFTGKTTMIIYLSMLTFMCLTVTIFGLGLSLDMRSEADKIWQGAALFTLYFTESLAFIFMFVFSIKEFSYLHDKRKTDMFGSLPASRRTIFFSKLAVVIVQSTVPMLLIVMFIAIMNNGTLPDYLGLSILFDITDVADKNVWYFMLQLFVGITANAVFLGFLSICCGKVSDKILTYIIINAAYPVSALLIQALPASFIIGYSTDINEFFTCALSPYTAMMAINPAYWAGFTILFGVLSFVLLPKRKAECAQSHFAFKAPLIVTKVLVSFASGMVFAYLFGLIFSYIKADKIAFIAGWFLGSFIAYFVIQIIFAKGFRRFGWGMIPYAGLVACFAVIMIVLSTGMFGYENYVPKVEDVESVSLVGGKQVIISGKNVLNDKITDPDEIAECIEGHKEAIDYIKSKNPSIAELTFGSINTDEAYFDSESYTGTVTFSYKLKNGMTVERYYGEYSNDEIQFIKSDTFIKHTNLLFTVDAGYCKSLEFYSDYYDEEVYDEYSEYEEYPVIILIDGEEYSIDESFLNKKENRVKLIEALKQDIMTYGYDSYDEVCSISVVYTDDVMSYEGEYVAVKSTYKNTIELLKNSSKVQDNIAI